MIVLIFFCICWHICRSCISACFYNSFTTYLCICFAHVTSVVMARACQPGDWAELTSSQSCSLTTIQIQPKLFSFLKENSVNCARVCLFICLDNVYSENMLYEVFCRPLLTLSQLSISFDSSVVTFSGLVNSRTRPSRNPYKNFQLSFSLKIFVCFLEGSMSTHDSRPAQGSHKDTVRLDSSIIFSSPKKHNFREFFFCNYILSWNSNLINLESNLNFLINLCYFI